MLQPPATAPADSTTTATRLLHREQQVQQLQLLLSLPHAPDVLLHGPACTAKTSIVRQVLAGRPHAYVSCCRTLKLRSLLSSVLAQLSQGGKRKRAHAFAAAGGTEHSLVWELKAACPPDAPCKVLVLDEMQQLLAANEGPLGALLTLREQAGINLALVMISRQHPAAQGLLALLPGVVPLSCPAYSDEQLVDILAAAGPPSHARGRQLQQAADNEPYEDEAAEAEQEAAEAARAAEVYRRFLGNTLVPQFHRLSRCLPDIACQAAALWPRYLAGGSGRQQDTHAAAAGADDAETDAGVDEEARMYSGVSERLAAALSRFQPAACCALAPPATAAAGSHGQQQRVAAVSGAQMAAGLELCRLSKLLLIAAFLASRNKPSVDKQLFAGSTGWRGGRRRRNVLAADRQAEAAKAAELKGPHTFSLSRLLTIYSNLLAGEEQQQQQQGATAASSGGWQQQQQRQAGSSGNVARNPALLLASAGWMGVQRCDVLMGVNTLVAVRLLSQACDDVLEAPRYSCEAPQELVEQLALDTGILLTSYLKYV